jgi:hypothetical protein
LIGRDAVNALDPDTHKIGAATRNDESFEIMRAQVAQEFEHGLVDDAVVGLAVFWVQR